MKISTLTYCRRLILPVVLCLGLSHIAFGQFAQTNPGDTVETQSGVQGAPNPMQDNNIVKLGLNLTGRFILDKNNFNSIMLGGTTGRASGHRALLLEFSPNDAVITNNGLDLMTHWTAYAGYNHYWSRSFNSTFAAYWADLDNSQFQTDDNIQSGGTFHVNLVWFPYKLVSSI